MRILPIIRVGLWIIFMIVFARKALASNDDQQAKQYVESIPTRLTIERTGYADINDTDAYLALTRYTAGLRWNILLLEVGRHQFDWHDGSSSTRLEGRDPWDSLTRIAPGLRYSHNFGSGWGGWAKFVAIAGFENSIRAKSWTYNPQLIGFHTLSGRTKLSGGLGMLYHSTDTVLYPVLGVAWIENESAGYSGALWFPSTMVRYCFNGHLSMKLDSEWDIRHYSHRQDNAFISRDTVENVDNIPGLHLEYEPVEQMRLSLGVRRFLGRSITVFDHHDRELRSTDVDPAWSVIAGVS
jgi:hypothetical protein